MNETQAQPNGHHREQGSSMSAEQEMAVKLKLAIDQRGKYSYKLNDFATGYAAGKGVTMTQARTEIERQFEKQFKQTPKQYLDERFTQRMEQSQSRGMGR